MSISGTVHFQFSSSWSFLLVSFSIVLFRLDYVIFSNQLPVVFSVFYSCRVFPIIGQLFHSYNLYLISHSQFSSVLGKVEIGKRKQRITALLPFSNFWRTRVVFSQFGANDFTHIMYTYCQIPNFLIVSLLLFFRFSSFLALVSEFLCRLSSLGNPFKM